MPGLRDTETRHECLRQTLQPEGGPDEQFLMMLKEIFGVLQQMKQTLESDRVARLMKQKEDESKQCLLR